MCLSYRLCARGRDRCVCVCVQIAVDHAQAAAPGGLVQGVEGEEGTGRGLASSRPAPSAPFTTPRGITARHRGRTYKNESPEQ